MGKLIGGLNGPFTGKVGSVIGSSRNGVPYMKGPYKKRTENISDKEVFNRQKFAAAQLWLKPLVPVVRLGFNGINPRSGSFISAKSYLMRNAMKVDGNKIIIDPALVKVSSGDLPMAGNVSVSQTDPKTLTFTWDPISSSSVYSRDQVSMLAYNIQDGRACHVLNGQFRSAGQDVLTLYEEVKPGSVLHVYMAFVSADRSRQSDSFYLGEVTIADMLTP